ncbi:GTP-binding protein EngC [Nocardiopsis sp. TSRI0078]|uniref:ribosome small subunit-dependent GTPase A n=1 Tax=unclassified Nocardiopsis TaxID=2649073 RepID=UPI00093B7422|nr:ribosome small subunit-dependent GTPase A [Nocardiopsis sp. TSRI0078]OKI21983.1 GTP-binding protein EngC [Nocardiopsis sp. TSRI0078]
MSTYSSTDTPTVHPLTPLGWNRRVEQAFDAAASGSAHPLTPARVASVRRGAAVVRLPRETTADYSPAVTRAAQADPSAAPCAGDWVAVRRSGDAWLVEAVLERAGSLVRQGVAKDSHDQVLAANIDAVLICEAADQGPNVGRLERFLSLAWASGATPVVAVTKAELAGERLPEVLELVESVTTGADVYTVSAHTGLGLEELSARFLPGTTWVLLGTSGAGKSSLVNAVAGRTLMDTGEIRQDRRGRHTTTHRQLLQLPGGALVLDIPGVRRIDVPGAETGVDQAFADVTELAERCRFRDCAHGAEPGCAVNAAVDEGELDVRRLERWNRLRREAEWNRSRGDARLRAERRRQWKAAERQARENAWRKRGR